MNKTNTELLNEVKEEIMDGIETRGVRYASKARQTGTDWIGIGQNLLVATCGVFIVAVGIVLMLP